MIRVPSVRSIREDTNEEEQLFGRSGDQDEREPDRGCGLAVIEVLQYV
jgi:hypothetical protein